MDPVLELLKEYRDCYTSNDRRYKKFNVVISRIETNKDSVSRYDLSQMMFDLLNPQRQLDYISAITICMKNPEYKKAMEMPAADKPRELIESIQKRKSDLKKPTNQNNARFKKFSTRGQFRPRGSFRQSNFRFNRNYQRGNNFRQNNRFNRSFNQNQQRPYRQNRSFQNNYQNDYREPQNNPNNFSGNNNAQNLNQPPPYQKPQNNRGNFRGSNNR